MSETLAQIVKDKSQQALGDIVYTYTQALASGKSYAASRKIAKLSMRLANELNVETRLGVQITKSVIRVQDMNNNYLGGKRLFNTLGNSHLEFDRLQVLKSSKEGKWLCEVYEKAPKGYQLLTSKVLPKGNRHMVYELGKDTWKVAGLQQGTEWFNCTKDELTHKMLAKGYQLSQIGNTEGLMQAIPVENKVVARKQRSAKPKDVEAGNKVDFQSSKDSLERTREIVSAYINS